MPGTKIGGQKATQKILASDPDFYRRIGSKGGQNGNTGGFACDIECNCKELRGKHYKKQRAGKRGGTISRRAKLTKENN